MNNADGTITIRTKVDTNGIDKGTVQIEKGLGKIKNSLASLSKAMLLAFGFSALVKFSKDSIKASTELENAMKGLQSIVEGQGRSFEKAQEFIQGYISDGLIPATNAITAYKNLASRGYTDIQIQTTLEALKDSATYGRQASLSLGDAVQTATEGLKNENSILVDNAGVTKNVAKMWQDYAKSIGTTANALTKEQKIQAEVNGIMEETRFQTGNAKTMADSYSGVMLKLAFVFNDLKVAVGNFLKPLVQIFVPILTNTIKLLTVFFNMLAKFTATVFGVSVNQSKQQEKSIGSTVDSEKELGKETDKTNKKTAKQLTSFDEIEKLSAETADNMGDVGDTGIGDIETGEITGDVTIDTDIKPVNEFVEKTKKLFADLGKWFDKNFTPLFKEIWKNAQPNIAEFQKNIGEMFYNLETLKEPLINFFTGDFTNLLKQFVITNGVIFNGLFDSFNLVFFDIVNKGLIPFLNTMLTTVIPYYAQLSTQLINSFEVAFGNVKEIFDTLWSEAVAPAMELVIQIWSEAWGTVMTTWEKYGQPIFDEVNKAINITGDIIMQVLNDFVIPVWESFMEVIDVLWTEHFQPLLANIQSFIAELVLAGLQIYNEFIAPLVEWIIAYLAPAFVDGFTAIMQTLGGFLGFVGDIVNSVITVLRGILEFLVGVFTNDWEKTWNGISMIFQGIWDGIVLIAKGAINMVIDLVNGLVRGVVKGMNAVINALNSISFELPDWLGGDSFGLNIPTITAPQIPRLAKGAVIPPNKQFIAILGDQTSGTNIETPLETMIQAFRMANAESGSRDMTIVLEMNNVEFARAVYKSNKEETQRVGVNLAVGGNF